MGNNCCSDRAQQQEQDSIFDEDFKSHTWLPTFENIAELYRECQLPIPNKDIQIHIKERIFYMLINLMRTRPTLFNNQLSSMKVKQDMLTKNLFGNYTFSEENVERALHYLNKTKPVLPLQLSGQLCQLCWECRDFYSIYQLIPGPKSNKTKSIGGLEDEFFSPIREEELSDDSTIMQLESEISKKYDTSVVDIQRVKELCADFIVWDDLATSALKEFFELFINSMKKDGDFHIQIFGKEYNSVGVGITVKQITQGATVRILLQNCDQ